MGDYTLRPKARQDLEKIWFYTYENWGEDQADSYIYDIDKMFQELAAHPQKGLSCDEIREGYRKQFVGKHVIFYRFSKKGIEIVRILHQSMDIERHL